MQFTARVRFERPEIHQLTADHTVVDLHFHSHYSDGLNSIQKIVGHARKLGIGVAITDHNEIRGALEIDTYDDILSIPGIEITAAEGAHLLVYFFDCRTLQHFYEHHVAPFKGVDVMSSLSLTMEQLLERTLKYDCVTIFAHPYCAMYTGVCNPQFSDAQLHHLLEMADGVEAINANNLYKWNLKCTVLGFNLKGAMVGGSDGHSLGHMGRAVSYADCPKNRQDFLDQIKQQKNWVMGKEIDLLRKVTSNSLKIRSSVNNCHNLFQKNISYGCKVIHLKSKALRASMQRRIHMRFPSHPISSDAGM